MRQKKIKVRVYSNDSYYWLELYSDHHKSSNLSYIEITRSQWTNWQIYAERDKLWGEQYEKDHPPVTSSCRICGEDGHTWQRCGND